MRATRAAACLVAGRLRDRIRRAVRSTLRTVDDRRRVVDPGPPLASAPPETVCSGQKRRAHRARALARHRDPEAGPVRSDPRSDEDLGVAPLTDELPDMGGVHEPSTVHPLERVAEA